MTTLVEERDFHLFFRELFRQEESKGWVFRVVNNPFRVTLRGPTDEEIAKGIQTPETTCLKVKPPSTIIVRVDQGECPIWINTPDGRRIVHRWVTSHEKVIQDFEFERDIEAARPGLGIRRAGEPVPCVQLGKTFRTIRSRGVETWFAGSFVSCLRPREGYGFTPTAAALFHEMRQPADEQSRQIFERLWAAESRQGLLATASPSN